MKIVCTRKRELHEKDPLIVMIPPPEDFPGPKIVIAFPIGQEVDLKALVKERGLKYTPEELAHTIMGDKRYKGLFKVAGAGATVSEEPVTAVANDEPTPTPKKKRNGTLIKKPVYDDKSINTSSIDAG